MFERPRVLREIARNAARVLGCAPEALRITVGAHADHGHEALVGLVDAAPAFRAIDATEEGALWRLMTQTIDAANGAPRPSQQLVMSPALTAAIRLLQLTRRELIEEIRRELEAPAKR